MGDYAKKPIEKRKEELRRLSIENKRREEVVKEKKLGKKIQGLERERKLLDVNSLKERINLHLLECTKWVELFRLSKKSENPAEKDFTEFTGIDIILNYVSIKRDFKEVFKDNYKKAHDLFPNVNVSMENVNAIFFSISSIMMQERDMLMFLKRF